MYIQSLIQKKGSRLPRMVCKSVIIQLPLSSTEEMFPPTNENASLWTNCIRPHKVEAFYRDDHMWDVRLQSGEGASSNRWSVTHLHTGQVGQNKFWKIHKEGQINKHSKMEKFSDTLSKLLQHRGWRKYRLLPLHLRRKRKDKLEKPLTSKETQLIKSNSLNKQLCSCWCHYQQIYSIQMINSKLQSGVNLI